MSVINCGILHWRQQISDVDTILPADLGVVKPDPQFLTGDAYLPYESIIHGVTFKTDPDTITCIDCSSQ